MTRDLREPGNGGALVVESLRKRFGGVEVLAGVKTALPEGVITGFMDFSAISAQLSRKWRIVVTRASWISNLGV